MTFEGTEEALLRGWTERLQALPMEGSFAGILHTKNDTLADAVKDEGTDILFGREHFYEELLGLRFQISPFSFFQTNSLGAEVLYEKTREYVGETKGKVVFDLYSGTGTIAQILAPVAEKVVGVEIVGEAVEAARENAARNGLGNCEFLAGDVLKVVDELEEKPDLDRSGSAARRNPSEGDRKDFEFWRQPHGLCVLQTNQPLRGIWNRSRRQDIRWIRCAAWICSRILPIVRRWFH